MNNSTKIRNIIINNDEMLKPLNISSLENLDEDRFQFKFSYDKCKGYVKIEASTDDVYDVYIMRDCDGNLVLDSYSTDILAFDVPYFILESITKSQ